MASTTLSVTVNGGVPPTSIQVRLFSSNGPEIDLSSPKSFSHDFPTLTSGNYDLYIVGMNPAGGNTVCVLSPHPDITINAPDDSPATAGGGNYVVQFHLKVK